MPFMLHKMPTNRPGGKGLIMLTLQKLDNLKLSCSRITAEKIDCLDTSFENFHWRDVAVPESVQSCFELSIHLSV